MKIQMMKIKGFARAYLIISARIFIVASVLLGSFADPAIAEISVESYCQLTIESMRQEVSNVQVLIALIDQYKNNPKLFLTKEKEKKIEFDQARQQLYASRQTNDEEYAKYMGEHSAEVNTCLANNPDKAQELKALAAQVDALLKQYEALRPQ